MTYKKPIKFDIWLKAGVEDPALGHFSFSNFFKLFLAEI